MAYHRKMKLDEKAEIDIDFTAKIRSLLPGRNIENDNHWLELAYDISDDYLKCLPVSATSYSKQLDEYYEKFSEVAADFGVETATKIYNTGAGILPSELCGATEYLSIGGDVDSLHETALKGYFWGGNYDSGLSMM